MDSLTTSVIELACVFSAALLATIFPAARTGASDGAGLAPN